MPARYEVPFPLAETGYDQAVATVTGALRFGISPMLESVVDMLCELGHPDASFEAVQVAGTNGKTSTSRYTAALLGAEGLRCALYTSPELVSYTERMEVAGHPVSEEAFAHGVTAATEAGRRVNARRKAAGERPYDITEFDLLTVAAMVAFAEAKVDVAVLECGMGGRWDATSAVSSVRTVAITGIGLDHMRILGDTLEAIAAEKAAIIQAGRGCVLGAGTATPTSVEDLLLARCAQEQVAPTLVRPAPGEDGSVVMQPGETHAHPELPAATWCTVTSPDGARELEVTTPLVCYAHLSADKPTYQAANIACAITLAETYLGRPLDAGLAAEAIARCPVPGRFEVLHTDPLVVIDACHNPQSVHAFLAEVARRWPDREARPQLLVAALADKDVAGMVALLAPEFPHVVVTQTSSPRALPAAQLAVLFCESGVEPDSTWPDVTSAVAHLSGSSYVACGSITLAGELKAIVR